MANVKQTQKMIPFVMRQISLGYHVCQLDLGVNVFDLDFGSKLIRSNNQSGASLLRPGNMSLLWDSFLSNHLDYCFVVFKHMQQSFLMRKLDVSGNTVNIIENIDHSSRLLVIRVTTDNGSRRSLLVLHCIPKDLKQ